MSGATKLVGNLFNLRIDRYIHRPIVIKVIENTRVHFNNLTLLITVNLSNWFISFTLLIHFILFSKHLCSIFFGNKAARTSIESITFFIFFVVHVAFFFITYLFKHYFFLY